MAEEYLSIEQWVQGIIVDPLSKEPLKRENDFLVSPYGRKYPVVKGVYDFRLLNNDTTNDQKIWKKGQTHYESLSRLAGVSDDVQGFTSEIEGVRDVYEHIPVEGRCLDVGGNQGSLRCFLAPDQQYISCDPFIGLIDNIRNNIRLSKHFPFLSKPLNFVCCDAEFLPFQSASFLTVHMRSVIDHFLNPELALIEAYRVLKQSGTLIIGLYVTGGKTGRIGFGWKVKNLIKSVLEFIGIDKFKDYHVWHPTYKGLVKLIESCGFSIEVEHWQKGYHDTVCYLKCRKVSGLTRSE